MIPRFRVVIPARYASTRLPGKPLAEVGGMPMVVRVAQRALESGADEVVIATDHEAIGAAARLYGIHVQMTSEQHVSGTDRIAEVVAAHNWPDETLVVNVQGDEPLIDPQLIRNVAIRLDQCSDASVATACHRLGTFEEFLNPNVVKLVMDRAGRALYFSRAPIPWARDAFAAGMEALPAGLPVCRHIGLYAYRAGFLRHYGALAPAPIEQFEALEQLRVLWHGYTIVVAEANEAPSPGVDTPEDLARVNAMLAAASPAVARS